MIPREQCHKSCIEHNRVVPQKEERGDGGGGGGPEQKQQMKMTF